MSLFSWFCPKSLPKTPSPMDAYGLAQRRRHRSAGTRRDSRSSLRHHPPMPRNRKNERMERRELLYSVVRDAMVKAAVLSASYKFKVLSLDQRGRQFLVMMDIAGNTVVTPHAERDRGTDCTDRQGALRHCGQCSYIGASTTMWPWACRRKHRYPGRRQPRCCRCVWHPSATCSRHAAPAAPAASRGPRFDPIRSRRSGCAFKQALATAARPAAAATGVPVRSGPSRPSPSGWTSRTMEMPDSRPQGLSGTQYGDL